MTKAAILFLGLAAVIVLPVAVSAAQDGAALAVNEAVRRQAYIITLQQKLVEAQGIEQRGDIPGAAKAYQEACDLVQRIGTGADAEAAQAIGGLVRTRMILARDAQRRRDFREANLQVQQVLNVDPKNQEALIFKAGNDRALAGQAGQVPDEATVARMPQIAEQKTAANTLVRSAQMLYEAGKLDDAEIKLKQALALDPDNTGAYYYLNLIQQGRFSRSTQLHTTDTQTRMADVEKRWVIPTSRLNLPIPNSYATNPLSYIGPGRQVIMDKLNRISLASFAADGLPLSEVVRNLREQVKSRDPERKGINFIINPNVDKSGIRAGAVNVNALGGQGGGGGYAAPPMPAAMPQPGQPGAIDPATGLPIPGGAAAADANETVDTSAFVIRNLELNDVRLADVLNAICRVSDHPLKYEMEEYAVVFTAKGPETPEMFIREFKVDPNTFYSGLESVSSQSFGSVNNNGGGGGMGGGGGGGGGNNNQNNGAVVGVVNAFAGAGSMRNMGNSGGGGGGGGGGGQYGSVANFGGGVGEQAGGGGGGGGGGGMGGGGGLRYITQINPASEVSVAARAMFTTLGVNMDTPPGKAVFFNDRTGVLLVRATADDLDTINRAIEVLNRVAPQVHIKARFVEVSQTDDKALGLDWRLGQFNLNSGGSVVGQGGSSGSLTVPVTAASPLGTFPGSTAASQVPASVTDQMITSGLRNGAPTLGTITGILTNPQFQVALHALEQRSGVELLAEPEVVTTSGRQTQMRATSVRTIITDFSFQQGQGATTTGGVGTTQ